MSTKTLTLYSSTPSVEILVNAGGSTRRTRPLSDPCPPQKWDGPKSTFLAASTTQRVLGGLAVGQLLEGNGSIVIKDGKPLGQEASGKAMIKFASGPLASLSGLKWVSKPTGSNR